MYKYVETLNLQHVIFFQVPISSICCRWCHDLISQKGSHGSTLGTASWLRIYCFYTNETKAKFYRLSVLPEAQALGTDTCSQPPKVSTGAHHANLSHLREEWLLLTPDSCSLRHEATIVSHRNLSQGQAIRESDLKIEFW